MRNSCNCVPRVWSNGNNYICTPNGLGSVGPAKRRPAIWAAEAQPDWTPIKTNDLRSRVNRRRNLILTIPIIISTAYVGPLACVSNQQTPSPAKSQQDDPPQGHAAYIHTYGYTQPNVFHQDANETSAAQ